MQGPQVTPQARRSEQVSVAGLKPAETPFLAAGCMRMRLGPKEPNIEQVGAISAGLLGGGGGGEMRPGQVFETSGWWTVTFSSQLSF